MSLLEQFTPIVIVRDERRPVCRQSCCAQTFKSSLVGLKKA